MRLMPTSRFASLIVACMALAQAGRSAEPYIPKRPKDLDEVVRVGNEVDRVLERIPLEKMSDHSSGESDDGARQGRTTTYWVLMVVFNAVGISFFIYGRKQARPEFLVCGILLMIFPYFVVDSLLTAAAGALLCAAPWLCRRIGLT